MDHQDLNANDGGGTIVQVNNDNNLKQQPHDNTNDDDDDDEQHNSQSNEDDDDDDHNDLNNSTFNEQEDEQMNEIQKTTNLYNNTDEQQQQSQQQQHHDQSSYNHVIIEDDDTKTIYTNSNNKTELKNSDSNSTPHKKARTAAIPGKPRGATYDGNACMICSDRASGFHYGVLACEGCKGFFKRICKEPNDTQTKRHCVYGGNCDINLRTRNRCQYCRIQKCIQLGMSKDGIKLGRRSRKFKENLIQIVSSTTSPNTTVTTTITTTQSTPSSSTPSTSINTINTNPTKILQHIDLIANINKLQQQQQHIQPQTNSTDFHSHYTNIQHGGGSSTSLNITPTMSTTSINTNNNNINTINGANNQNNSFITINTDNQIQQIIIPADQSHLLTSSNTNKQVIAIIQDNRLILKTIDIPHLLTTSCVTSTSIATATTTTATTTTTSAANAIAAVVSSSSSSSSTQAMPALQQIHIIQPKQETNDLNYYQMNTAVQQQQQQQAKLLPSNIYQILDTSQIQQINDIILQAHKDTWPYSKEKCKKLKQMYAQSIQQTQFQLKQHQLQLELDVYFQNGLLNFLKESKFLEIFNQLIENTVLFAKIVPYFMDMHESDRIAMLKSCVFEIICVRHMILFEQSFKFFLPVYELYITKDYLMQKFPEYLNFIDLLFDFYLHFTQIFELNDMEYAIFCSFLLFNTDDDVQLNDSEKLLTYRNLFRGLLINELCKNHGQQYKEIDIQAWLDKCCLKLKNLNLEHSQILTRLKKSIQFPDLYAELYNL